jgi:hypothetical protein
MLQATLRYFQRLLVLDFNQAAYDHFIECTASAYALDRKIYASPRLR